MIVDGDANLDDRSHQFFIRVFIGHMGIYR